MWKAEGSRLQYSTESSEFRLMMESRSEFQLRNIEKLEQLAQQIATTSDADCQSALYSIRPTL
jgi:hypothetical protein